MLSMNELLKKYLARTKDGLSVVQVRMPLKEQIFFAKRLSFLMDAGVPLIESLHIIKSQTKKSARAQAYESIIGDIANGQYLSKSLAKFRHMFSDFAINLIKVGETSGILNQNLAYLADELAKKDALKKKVVGAMVYPIFITVATLGIVTLLTVYIFPKITPIFTSLKVPLPLVTRVLMAVSDYLREWGLLTLCIVLLCVFAFMMLRVFVLSVRQVTDRFFLTLPIIGSLAKSYNLANANRTLGLMLQSGVPVTSALTVTAETMPNLAYKQAFTAVAEVVLKGGTISQGLREHPALFTDMMVHLITVGETTGNLSQTLVYLAGFYELEVEDLTKNLSSSIEPALMIVMGLLVGLIAVSVITPIYAITQHLTPR